MDHALGVVEEGEDLGASDVGGGSLEVVWIVVVVLKSMEGGERDLMVG